MTLLAVAMIIAIAGLTFIGWPGRSYRDSDFAQFYAGAVALREGASPYDIEWWTGFHDRIGSQAIHSPPQPAVGSARWSTPYPLWTFVPLVPLAYLPLAAAAAAWLVVQVSALLAGLVALGRVVLAWPRRDLPVLLAVAFGSQPLWVVAGGGNISGLMSAALAGSVAATLTGRAAWGGALLALTLAKPQSFAFVGLALLAGVPAAHRKAFLGASLAVAAALAVVSFALDPGWIGGWLRSVTALQATEYSNATGWTVGRLVFDGPAATIISFAAVLGTIAILIRWARTERPALSWLVAAAVPVSLFSAPHGWSYDQLSLVVSATVVLGSAPNEGAARGGRPC
jgi:hypothetical protein